VLQISAAIAAEIDLIQLREKRLTARVLFELTEDAVKLSRGTPTRILVNDRADIATGAGAHGVHLTTQSLDADTVRKMFGPEFLVGASTHSLEEARATRVGGADFVVFGPVYQTASKGQYGPAVGLEALAEVSRALDKFPVLALGGISLGNARDCLAAGASGVAAITLFSEAETLKSVAAAIRESGRGVST